MRKTIDIYESTSPIEGMALDKAEKASTAIFHAILGEGKHSLSKATRDLIIDELTAAYLNGIHDAVMAQARVIPVETEIKGKKITTFKPIGECSEDEIRADNERMRGT